MEVVVENLGGLKRKFTITIPLEKVSSTYEACYQKLKSKVKVNGFRQGAFPKKLMEKRFKESMGQEALETLIPEHFQAALTQESTESATQPKFDSLNIEKNKPLAFVATFEATPTFDVSLEGLSLDKKEIVITDEEKAERRASLLKEHATFGTKDGAAEEKDQVTMDFAPSEGQESFGNGNDRAEGHVYIVGSKQLLPEFEEALLGMKAGENKDFPLTFPADYHAEELQGKEVSFNVKVNEVKSQQEPELNEELLKKFGEDITTVEAFEKFVEGQIDTEKETANKTEYRKAIAEQLNEKLDFDIPEELLGEELKHRIQQGQEHVHDENCDHEKEEEVSDEEKKETYTKEIQNRLRLYYLVEKVRENEKIEVGQNEVYQRFYYYAYMMQQNPQELAQSEYGKSIMQNIHAELVEESVLNFIADKVISE